MSAFSTLRITKRKAKDMVYRYMLEYGCDDNFLRQWCDHILEDRLYDCQIVDDGEENDDAVV